MTRKPPHPGTNALLAELPPAQRDRLLADAARVTLDAGRVLADAEQPIAHVFLPTTAVFSVLSLTTERHAVETAVIGYEGMTPLAAFHQVECGAEQVIVQVPGEAWRMTREAFHSALADLPALRRQLHRFSQALFTFAAQSSACNRQHSVVQRCARWLLTTHDRVPTDEFPLTHQFLSQMLGVRRSSVTVAAEVLRAAGAMTYTRGRIRVLSRDLLLARACDCYAIIRSTYDRLLAGEDTPSPLASLALSSGGESLAGDGTPAIAATTSSVPSTPEASLSEFSARLRQARERSDELRAAGEAGAGGPATIARLTDELSIALEQLEVAEEEMRAQVEALQEMRTALEVQQQLWRARFDGLPDAFLETDQHDAIVEINRACEQLLGVPRARVLGKPLVTLFPDTDRRGLRDVLTRLRRGVDSDVLTGTLLAARGLRPEVQIAVAATPRLDEQRVAESDGSAERPVRFSGARWLLRLSAKAAN